MAADAARARGATRRVARRLSATEREGQMYAAASGIPSAAADERKRRRREAA